MKHKHTIWMLYLVLVLVITLIGCSSAADRRSPEKWLSLSYSGLAAMDQYSFTGSMSIKTADGLAFKPQVFQGKVVDHKQLTVQTSSEDPLHWNPVQVLATLKDENKEVRMMNDTDGPETVTLHITEASTISKQKWEQRLHQQLDQLGANAPASGSPYQKEWTEELARSRKQLDRLLSSMEAVTEYELVIDRNRLLPLKMDETTVFHYKHNGLPVSEERHTTVRFQSFDGASSGTIQ